MLHLQLRDNSEPNHLSFSYFVLMSFFSQRRQPAEGMLCYLQLYFADVCPHRLLKMLKSLDRLALLPFLPTRYEITSTILVASSSVASWAVAHLAQSS